VAVDSHLHRVNLSARRSTHQRPQGKTKNHQENTVLDQPWVFVESQQKSHLPVATGQELAMIIAKATLGDDSLYHRWNPHCN
jgi:hypothetical protein